MREKLLQLIEQNSRMDIKQIAEKLNENEKKVMEELVNLESERVICGYNTLIDWSKTSIEKITALIEVRVSIKRGQGFDRIAARIYNYDEVKSVYLISGAFDLLVILEEKTLREIANFVSDKLSTIDNVISTATHFVLKKYKDYGIIFDKRIEDDREVVSL